MRETEPGLGSKYVHAAHFAVAANAFFARKVAMVHLEECTARCVRIFAGFKTPSTLAQLGPYAQAVRVIWELQHKRFPCAKYPGTYLPVYRVLPSTRVLGWPKLVIFQV